MMKRRFVQGLLILALLCGAVLLAHPAAAWAGTIEPTRPTQGDGSAERPYEIDSAAELYWFEQLVNGTLAPSTPRNNGAHARLTADITLEEPWTPIGSVGIPYHGTFDGAGYRITGLNIEAGEGTANAGYGFFGAIDSGGVVKNLKLVNGSIRVSNSSGSNYVGGICGRNNGGTIENCSNGADVYGDMSANVGGICGLNMDESAVGSITNCTNSGSVNGGFSNGGICGYNSSILRDCINTGTIGSSAQIDGVTVGGICGKNIARGSISSCENRADVDGGETVGGVCGDNGGSITDCSNSGGVKDNGAWRDSVNIGGICGTNGGTIGYSGNTGMISGSGSVINGTERGTIGGICGWNGGSGRLVACSNDGSVSKGFYIGGICGNNDAAIISCSNSSNRVSGSTGNTAACVGGICGANTGNIINSQCNEAVSSSGVMGFLSGQNNGSIQACYYLSQETLPAVGIGSGTLQAEPSTSADYASGEVAWLLNHWQGSNKLNGKVWAVGEEGYPVLNGKSDNIVVKLTFNANTGKEEDNFIRYANAGAALPSVEPPAREGYIFAGWSTEQNGSGSSFSAITPQTDTILYAQWIEVTLNQTNFTYNGQPLEPDPIVKIGDQMLTKDTDYTVAYDNNVNVGTATITVTGIGSYTGISGSITFTIDPATLTIDPATLTIASADVADKTYDGSTAATVNSVTFSGVTNSDTLQLGSDYTATAVFDSADAGERTATVTVTLINSNYTLAEDATTCQATAIIAKADYDGPAAASGTIQPGASGTVALPALPDGASYGTPTTTDSAAVGSLSITGDRLSYSGGSISDGSAYTVTVPITGATNFNNYTITVTLTGDGSSTPSTPSTPVTPEPPADSEETVTNADGSTTTTITKEDGSTSTTTVTSDGKVEAEVTLSDEAITQSTESGDAAVALPVPEMTASSDRDTAPTVTVHLPENTTSAKVDIPVENVTAGTVAILVHEDGSEEVLKNTVQTESGISVEVSDGDILKIVDNSKTFDDVADDHWGAAVIDFVTSRELFAGTAENTFSPDSAMTRAMIWSVLARYEGADTTAAEGSAWYAGSQQWAIDNGISDGTNPNDPMTREQFAAMLYRSAGSPAVSGSVEDFGDAASVSSWASDAMIWAVQNGIIGGYEDSTLRPQNTATRTEVAAMLQRYVILNAQ